MPPTDSELLGAFMQLGVVATRNISARERAAIRLARELVMKEMGGPDAD